MLLFFLAPVKYHSDFKFIGSELCPILDEGEV